MSETDTALRVSIARAGSADAKTMLAQAQYTFSASIGTGPDAGKTISGTLMLKSEVEDGVTEVEGRIVPTTTASPPVTDDAQATADALRAASKAQLDALRRAFRSDVEALIDTLRSAWAAGRVEAGSGLTAAQSEALRAFKDSFAARAASFHDDVAMAVAEVETQLAALGVPGDGRRRRDEGGPLGYKVKGTIDASGKVTLTLRDGGRRTFQAEGQVGADGSLSGILRGPADGDEGTWTASLTGSTPAPTPPAPTPPAPTPPAPTPPAPTPPAPTPPAPTPPAPTPPAPTPPAPTPPAPTPPAPTPPAPTPPAPTPPAPAPATGNVANGLALYNANCSGCHGTSKASDSKVRTPAGITTVMNSVSNHKAMGLNTKFTDQDLLDLAAYIASPK